MEIGSIRHKALRSFAETGSARGLPGNLVGKLDDMLSYLGAISSPAELASPPNFGAHRLTGELAGRWSLVVTRNWRMTFGVNEANELVDLDLEDYH